MLSHKVHLGRGLTTSLQHRAGWNPELCDKSSRKKKGVHAPPEIEMGGGVEDFSNREPESIFEQHEPDRYGSTELHRGRAKTPMDNIHTNDCGWIPVSQDLQKTTWGLGLTKRPARVCQALILSVVSTAEEPNMLKIPKPYPQGDLVQWVWDGAGVARGFFNGRGRVRAFPKRVPMGQQEHVEMH